MAFHTRYIDRALSCSGRLGRDGKGQEAREANGPAGDDGDVPEAGDPRRGLTSCSQPWPVAGRRQLRSGWSQSKPPTESTGTAEMKMMVLDGRFSAGIYQPDDGTTLSGIGIDGYDNLR